MSPLTGKVEMHCPLASFSARVRFALQRRTQHTLGGYCSGALSRLRRLNPNAPSATPTSARDAGSGATAAPVRVTLPE